MRKTYKCHNCHEVFRAEEMIEYTSLGSKTSYRYCKKCYEIQKNREEFSNKVCEIFGLKRPNSQIWSQRKYLINTYGYTDNTIIDCLDYIYNVEKFKKQKITLGLVNPISVEKMMKYKRAQQQKANTIARAFSAQETKEYVVNVRENIKKNDDEDLNPDNWLNIE